MRHEGHDAVLVFVLVFAFTFALTYEKIERRLFRNSMVKPWYRRRAFVLVCVATISSLVALFVSLSLSDTPERRAERRRRASEEEAAWLKAEGSSSTRPTSPPARTANYHSDWSSENSYHWEDAAYLQGYVADLLHPMLRVHYNAQQPWHQAPVEIFGTLYYIVLMLYCSNERTHLLWGAVAGVLGEWLVQYTGFLRWTYTGSSFPHTLLSCCFIIYRI